MRSADHEAPGRIDVKDAIRRVKELVRQHGRDHLAAHNLGDRRIVDVGVVLRADNDRVHTHRAVTIIGERDLSLAVGAHPRHGAGVTQLGHALGDAMRKHGRCRHELGCLIAGKAEHHALVARTPGVDALRDVVGLLVERREHGAGVRVDAVFRAVVADAGQSVTHDLRQVDVGIGRDLTSDHGHARRDQRLTGHPRHRVFDEHGIEHSIRNLIGDLVGVPFTHRL